MDNRELLVVLKDTLQHLHRLDGIGDYARYLRLKPQVEMLEKEIAEEDRYIDMMAERLGY
jgi:hypothetical protein